MTFDHENTFSNILNLSLLKEALKQLPNLEPTRYSDNLTFLHHMEDELIFLHHMEDEFNIFTSHGGRINIFTSHGGRI